MPLYEYACKSCEHHFDLRHGADEKPEIRCPECAGEVRKVFHASGIIFKGSGWYVTDSANKSAAKSSKPVESPEATAEKSSSEAASSSSDNTSTESAEKKTPADKVPVSA